MSRTFGGPCFPRRGNQIRKPSTSSHRQLRGLMEGSGRVMRFTTQRGALSHVRAKYSRKPGLAMTIGFTKGDPSQGIPVAGSMGQGTREPPPPERKGL